MACHLQSQCILRFKWSINCMLLTAKNTSNGRELIWSIICKVFSKYLPSFISRVIVLSKISTCPSRQVNWKSTCPKAEFNSSWTSRRVFRYWLPWWPSNVTSSEVGSGQSHVWCVCVWGGRLCTVNFNASWVMVTWGPRWTVWLTRMKTLPSRNSASGW